MPGLTIVLTPEQDSAPNLSTIVPIDEISDTLVVMQYQESTSYRCRDYIDGNINVPRSRCGQCQEREPQDPRVIDRDCRLKMCEWCYQISDFCEFQRETVAAGMNYLDRFLSTSSPRAARALRDKKEFQLAAMTTLYIAVKLFEPLAMDAALFAQISQGCYTERDVVDMEEEILEALSWRVNGPTTHAFVSHLVALLPSSACEKLARSALFDFSRFQADIAVCDYDLSLQKPSIVALAALLNSIEGIDESLFPAQSRFRFFRSVVDASGMNPFSHRVDAVRAQLLRLFSKNTGYELPQIANLMPVTKTEQKVAKRKNSDDNRRLLAMSTGARAAKNLVIEPGTYGAKCA